MGGPPETLQRPRVTRRLARAAWRHRLATFFLLLIAATLGMRVVWGWRVQSQLDVQHAALRAQGVLLNADARGTISVPDHQNAQILIDRAVRVDNGNSPSNGSQTHPEYPPFGSRWDRLAAASETNNAQVMALARQMRMMDRPQMRTVWMKPVFLTGLPILNSARQVANTVTDGALYSHVRGDDREAIERLLDVVHLSSLVQQDDFMVSQLVGIGIASLATSRTNVIGPALRMEDPEVRRLTRDLIVALLEEGDRTDRMRRAIAVERLVVVELVDYASGSAWALRPLAGQEGALINARFAVLDQAARQANAEATRRVLALEPKFRRPTQAGKGDIPDYSLWYAGGRGSLSRYAEQEFRIAGERRATAVLLAIHLYRADHAGAWPEKLDELVPAYLSAVPLDPFPDDGRQIGYLKMAGGMPDGGDRRFVFYEAGPDSPAIIDIEPMVSWQGQEVRQYRDLSRWLPATRRVDVTIKAELEDERIAAEEAERKRKEQDELEKLEKVPDATE